MSSTTILKTGSLTRKPTRDISKKIDSKLSTINKVIETKVNKVGDKMTGNLNMSNNRITNVKDPEEDTDVINKGYCQDFFSYAGKLLKNDIISQVERDQSDAINKKYLQIASMEDNVKLKKLMSICRILKDVLMMYENEFPSKYYRPFNLGFTYLQNFILTFNRLYPNQELLPVLEKILYAYIKDVKCLLIAIIEDMSIDKFTAFIDILIANDLLVIPDVHTKLYNIRIFIEKFARNIDPNIITATRT